MDLAGPLADWTAHLSVVGDAAVPLPEPLAALLVGPAGRLTTTTADAPLVALRATEVLEWIAARVGGRPPTGCAATPCPPKRWPPLGTTRCKALVLLLTPQDG
ncbi:hypothetical protein [Streptomyces chryseus]